MWQVTSGAYVFFCVFPLGRGDPETRPYPVLDRRLSEDGFDDEEDDGFSPPESPRNPAKRFLILCACSLVGFVMNVLVSVVAPFFPSEARKLTGASDTVVGLIFAIFPLTNLVVCPLVNSVGAVMLVFIGRGAMDPNVVWGWCVQAIRTCGRKSILMAGLLLLAASTIGFGLSKSVPLWCLTRVGQGLGSAAAGGST
jgi:MFS family permease